MQSQYKPINTELFKNRYFLALGAQQPASLLQGQHDKYLLTHAFKDDGVTHVIGWNYDSDLLGRVRIKLNDEECVEKQLQKWNFVVPKYISEQTQINTAIAEMQNGGRLYHGKIFKNLWFNNNAINGYDECINALKNIQNHKGKTLYSAEFFAHNDGLMLAGTIRKHLHEFDVHPVRVNTRYYYNDIFNATTTDGVILSERIVAYYLETFDLLLCYDESSNDPVFHRLDFVV